MRSDHSMGKPIGFTSGQRAAYQRMSEQRRPESPTSGAGPTPGARSSYASVRPFGTESGYLDSRRGPSEESHSDYVPKPGSMWRARSMGNLLGQRAADQRSDYGSVYGSVSMRSDQSMGKPIGFTSGQRASYQR
ncbi:unnamed protein product [Ophioblennius macclurei]